MLQMLAFCYNRTEHKTTGFTPFFLCLLMLYSSTCPTVLLLTTMSLSLTWNMTCLKQHGLPTRTAERNKPVKLRNYNHKAKSSPLTVDDRVLLANHSERGKRKFADKWESMVFEVTPVKPGISVHCIRDPMTSPVTTPWSEAALWLLGANDVTQWFLLMFKTVRQRQLIGSCKAVC